MADNPQAFPLPHFEQNGRFFYQDGMTLRDWFAGQALAGSADGGHVPLYPNGDKPNFNPYARQQAQLAYALADAMLAEREKHHG